MNTPDLAIIRAIEALEDVAFPINAVVSAEEGTRAATAFAEAGASATALYGLGEYDPRIEDLELED
jgi:hypothetical protein